MNRKEIKARAKEFAFNNKWNIWKPVLIYYLIYYGIGIILGVLSVALKLDPEGIVVSLLDLALSLGTAPMMVGTTYYLIKLVKGKDVDAVKDLFAKYSIFGVIILSSLYIGIVTSLWSLLFVIPGIVYAFKVMMVPYLLADTGFENKSIGELIDTSKHMMDGYKRDYFKFALSFIGWIFLSMLTFGIALIWAVPYIEVACVMYYEELKKIKKVK